MSEQTKRIRSSNWDEDEKQLFRIVLKDYSQIIENKSLDTNNNKLKNKAWEEVHKKFNELNGRPRQLNQLKIQWKGMKMSARKSMSSFKKECNKTGGGGRPKTPSDEIVEVADLLNPAELWRDSNIYDDDGIITPTASTCKAELDTIIIQATVVPSQITPTASTSKTELDTIIQTMDVPSQISQEDDNIIMANTPIKAYEPTPRKSIFSQKPMLKKNAKLGSGSKKDQDDYIISMTKHSRMLKDEEHKLRMEMATEEHKIKMEIHKEKLKCAILEREILETKKNKCLE